MAVTIQDDMLLAASQMSKKDGDAFLLALLAYGATGAEPKGKPVWLPTFTTCKERIDMSEARRKLSQELNEAKRKKKTARNDRTEAPHGDTARSDRTDTPEKSREEMSRDETTTTRARAREGGGGGGCLKSEIRMGSSDGDVYPTPYDALLATYSDKTGSDVGFSRAISVVSSREACSDCPMSEEMVMECAKAAYDAIVDWDRDKASTPMGILKAAMRQVDGDA